MTIAEVVSYIAKRQAQGFRRSTDIIPLVRIVCDLLMKNEANQNLYLDSTGRVPSLTTRDGVYTYDGPDDTWRVSRVLISADVEHDYDYNFRYAESNDYLINYNDIVEIGGRFYYPFAQVQTFDALTGGVPQITFSINPGATTGHFFMQAYKNPSRVSSDRTQLPVPDSNGAHMLIVVPSVMKFIEAQNSGNIDEAVEYVTTVMRPRLMEILNSGASGRRHRTQARPY